MAGLQWLVMGTGTGPGHARHLPDPTAALYMGINVDARHRAHLLHRLALAGAAGVMAGGYYGKIDFLMGFIIGLKAFTAAVIGGIGNIKGAMLGGLRSACSSRSAPPGSAGSGAMCSPSASSSSSSRSARPASSASALRSVSDDHQLRHVTHPRQCPLRPAPAEPLPRPDRTGRRGVGAVHHRDATTPCRS